MVRNQFNFNPLSPLNTKGSSAILFAVVISVIAVGVHLGLGLYINMLARTAKQQDEKANIEATQNNSLSVISKLMGTGLIENKNGVWVSNITTSPNSPAFAWNFSPGDGDLNSDSPSADLAGFIPLPSGKTSNKDDDDKIKGAFKKDDDDAGKNKDEDLETGNNEDKNKSDIKKEKKNGKGSNPPKIAIKMCDPSRFNASDRVELFGAGKLPSQCLASNSQVDISNTLTNGKADVTLTSFKNSEVSGAEGAPSILKARIGTSLSEGPGPIGPSCNSVQNITSLNILYQTILGREMNSTEASALTDCISQGKMFPDLLESSESGLCGGLTALRLSAEYSKQMEVINNLYQLFLDRLPNEEDAAKIAAYRSTLGSNDKVTASSLKKVIAKMKMDHKLSGSPVLRLTAIQKYYDLMFGGSKKLAVSNEHLKAMAKGDLLFSKLRDLEFDSGTYRSRGKLDGERVSFLYFSLMNQWPSKAVHTSYVKLMSYGKTDPILQPLEWLAQDFRSSQEYAALGGCAIAPPSPQIYVKVRSSSLANWDGYKASEDRCVKKGTAIKDGTEPVKSKCPTGTIKRKVMIPNSVDKAVLKKTAVAFGNFSEVHFEGSIKTFDPSVKTIFTFPDISVALSTNGATISASGSVKGPSGNNVGNDSRTAEVRTPLTVINKLSNLFGKGPDSVYKLDSDNLKNLVWHDVLYPAPALFVTASNMDMAKENLGTGHAGEVDVTEADVKASVTHRRYFYWGWTLRPEIKSYYTDTFPGSLSTSGKTPPSNVIPSAASAEDYSVKVNDFTYMLRQSGTNWGSDWVQHFSSDYSPLVIDLYNEGVKLSSPDTGVLFDLEGKGVKSRYSWVDNTKSVAFIAYDKNHNGRIDDIHELFGDNTQGPDAKTAENGFESLIKYDANRDASLDAKDAIFDALLLWSDLNKNGISEPNELSPLALSGVKSIDLNYDGVTEVNDRHGNLTHGRSIAVMNDDSLRTIHDVWFVEGSTSKPQGSVASR